MHAGCLGQLLDLWYAVEPRHQRVVEGRWDEGRRRIRSLRDLFHPPGLDESFCKLLGEQGQAVRSRNNIGHELFGYALSPGSPLDDQLYQLTAEPVERQTRHMRMG